jgi:hypothetical protein
MSFSTPARGLFLAAGQAAQFYWTWGDWQGPRYFTPKLDLASDTGHGPTWDPIILVMQWQGTGNKALALGGGSEWRYYMGIHNPSTSNVQFHLEGGNAT